MDLRVPLKDFFDALLCDLLHHLKQMTLHRKSKEPNAHANWNTAFGKALTICTVVSSSVTIKSIIRERVNSSEGPVAEQLLDASNLCLRLGPGTLAVKRFLHHVGWQGALRLVSHSVFTSVFKASAIKTRMASSLCSIQSWPLSPTSTKRIRGSGKGGRLPREFSCQAGLKCQSFTSLAQCTFSLAIHRVQQKSLSCLLPVDPGLQRDIPEKMDHKWSARKALLSEGNSAIARGFQRIHYKTSG